MITLKPLALVLRACLAGWLVAGCLACSGRAATNSNRREPATEKDVAMAGLDGGGESSRPNEPRTPPGEPIPDVSTLAPPCRDAAQSYERALASATGRCGDDRDCGCYSSLAFLDRMAVTDRAAAERLDKAGRRYHRLGCPSVTIAQAPSPPCKPKCVDGVCRRY